MKDIQADHWSVIAEFLQQNLNCNIQEIKIEYKDYEISINIDSNNYFWATIIYYTKNYTEYPVSANSLYLLDAIETCVLAYEEYINKKLKSD